MSWNQLISQPLPSTEAHPTINLSNRKLEAKIGDVGKGTNLPYARVTLLKSLKNYSIRVNIDEEACTLTAIMFEADYGKLLGPQKNTVFTSPNVNCIDVDNFWTSRI